MDHRIRIEKIIHGGQGLGRLDNGIVVLTRFVLPGEEVLVKEIKRQRGYIEAEPVEILQSSPERIAPPCPYYMQCGGCDLQHMNGDAQHNAKEGIIRESLNRARVVRGDQALCPIIPSPKPFHYRYRIRLKISFEGAIGFHQASSNSIVDIAYCHVATDLLNRALAALRKSGIAGAIAPFTREIELLHSPADDRIFCLLHPHRNKSYPHEILTRHLPSLDIISGFAVKNGKDIELLTQDNQEFMLRQNFDASICGHPYSLTWTPGCFSQVNAEQNATIVRLACRLTGDTKKKEVLDLFCGTGNFSIPLALLGGAVTGIERHAECIEQAKNNGARARLDNALFFDRDASQWLRKAVRQSKKYGMVLLDPPRQGMGRDIALLTELLPSRIIYISCDPATLARDIAHLESHGYSLSSITPVDMFPQTHHIESVALLEKN